MCSLPFPSLSRHRTCSKCLEQVTVILYSVKGFPKDNQYQEVGDTGYYLKRTKSRFCLMERKESGAQCPRPSGCLVKTVGSLSRNSLKWGSKLTFIVAPHLAYFSLHITDDPFHSPPTVHIQVSTGHLPHVIMHRLYVFIQICIIREINDQMYTYISYKAYQVRVFLQLYGRFLQHQCCARVLVV